VKITPQTLREMKQRGEKIAVLTAYDFPTAQLMDQAGIPMILVGDSVGMVMLGYPDTRSVTMEDMLHHVRAVTRAKPRALVVADMPVNTYNTADDALANARRFRDAGADAVKLEGPVIEPVRALTAADIPVLGHIGLLPQSAKQYKAVGRNPESVAELLAAAKALETAGVFALVIECVVASVARQITASVSVPTIGIGAGPDCDGQVLVAHDLLGLYPRVPKHTRIYADLGDAMRKAFAAYRRDVQEGKFPGPEQSFS